MNGLSSFNQFNNLAHSSSGDLLVVALAAVLVGIYGFVLWRHQILINLLAIYIALLGVSWLNLGLATNAFGRWLESLLNGYTAIVLFLIFWLAAIFFLSFTHLIKRVSYEHSFLKRWLQALVSGVIQTGLIFSFVINNLSQSYRAYFSATQLKLFDGWSAQLIWLVLSLLSLWVIRNKRRGPGRPSY